MVQHAVGVWIGLRRIILRQDRFGSHSCHGTYPLGPELGLWVANGNLRYTLLCKFKVFRFFFLIFMSCAKRIMHTFAYRQSVARCLSVVLVVLIVVVCIKMAL